MVKDSLPGGFVGETVYGAVAAAVAAIQEENASDMTKLLLHAWIIKIIHMHSLVGGSSSVTSDTRPLKTDSPLFQEYTTT